MKQSKSLTQSAFQPVGGGSKLELESNLGVCKETVTQERKNFCNDGASVIQRPESEESYDKEVLRFAQDDGALHPRPLREREELLSEQSELSNSGEGCKDFPSPVAFATQSPKCRKTRHFDKMLKQVQHDNFSCAKHTEKDLSSNRPSVLTTLKNRLDCFAFARNDVSCAERTEKDLSSNRLIVLTNLKKCAFTLAEVLITLGIIGVVAAMTLPTMINKYRSYVLHKQFTKSYSYLSQTILLMKKDLGIENLQAYYVTFDYQILDFPMAQVFYSEFDKYVKTVKKVPRYSIKNYTNTAEAAFYAPGNDYPRPIYILPDGSSVGRNVNNGAIRFWIDSNGPKKGPNRYGFDIFEFRIDDSTDMLRSVKQLRVYTEEELKNFEYSGYQGQPCNKSSKQELNGIGCSWYALNNVNPDDETKKYWDSLPW